MSIAKWIYKNIEKRYPWGFIGGLLAILFGLQSVYLEFFKETNPRLEYTIETNTRILDLHEELPKLKILYDSSDLKTSHRNLSILQLRIANTGPGNVTKEMYDSSVPLGFRLQHCKIVEKPELIAASSDYIRDVLKVKVDSNRVFFTPFIFESEEYFDVKCLVIHANGTDPRIVPTGKVAGVKNISVFNASEKKDETYWHRTFSGSFWVQAFRFLGYNLIGTAIVVIVMLLYNAVQSIELRKERRRRNKMISRFIRERQIVSDGEYQTIFTTYISFGGDYLRRIMDALADKQFRSFINLWAGYKYRYDNNIKLDIDEKTEKFTFEQNPVYRSAAEIAEFLFDTGLMTCEMESAKISPTFTEKLTSFVLFVLS
jgi:hypothetical protein